MNKTSGNVIVDEIQVGDIHYEFQGGRGSKFIVITKPTRDIDGQWSWMSKNLNTGKIISYFYNENYPHYSPKLYNYEAYIVNQWV